MATRDGSKIFTYLWYATEAEEAARSKRVADAMLRMVKLDIAALERARRA